MIATNITPTDNLDLDGLYDYIAECASVVRDKTPKSAEKLFNRLQVETTPYTGNKITHNTYLRLCGV